MKKTILKKLKGDYQLKRKRLGYSTVAALSAGLVLAACGDVNDENFENDNAGNNDVNNEADNNDNEDEENDDADEGEAQEGGNATVAMYSTPEHQFNPIYYTSSYDNNIIEFAYESLFAQDEELEFYNELAEDWEMNDDQTEMTVELRDDVTWHDGEEFTADDVVFTYTMIASPEYIGVRQDYVDDLVGYEEFSAGDTDEFEGVRAEDDHTVVFEWEEPTVTPQYDTGYYIIPEHVFEDADAGEIEEHPASTDPEEIVGTGPFQMAEYEEGDYYFLEKYEDYWGGEPNLDSVTWEVIDQSVMTGLLDSGDIDAVFEPDGIEPVDLDTVEAMDNINMYQPQDLGYQYMGFKLAHRPSEDVENAVYDVDNYETNEKLEDPRVRQAIAYGVDREAMVEGLIHGSGQVLHAPFPEASWAYDEDAPVKYEYNVEQAQELMEEAGYEDVTDDGYYEDPDGEEYTLNLEYPTGNEPRERAATVIEQNLEEVGIRVDVQSPREFDAHATRVEEDEPDMDLYLMGWSLASGDPDPSAIFGAEAAYNYPRWYSEESEQLMEEATQAPDAFDQEYRQEKYAEWAEHVSEELPMLFLWSMENNFAYTDRLGGVTENPVNMYKNTHEWYVTEE